MDHDQIVQHESILFEIWASRASQASKRSSMYGIPTTTTAATNPTSVYGYATPPIRPGEQASSFLALAILWICGLLESVLGSLLEGIVLPLFWNVILPASAIYIFIKLVIAFVPVIKAIYQKIRYSDILRRTKRAIHNALRTFWGIYYSLRNHFVLEEIRRHYNKFHFEDYWVQAVGLLIAFIVLRPFWNRWQGPRFVKWSELDGFKVPDYMLWERNEGGSNHVGRHEEEIAWETYTYGSADTQMPATVTETVTLTMPDIDCAVTAEALVENKTLQEIRYHRDDC